jgi:hypothetical protein
MKTRLNLDRIAEGLSEKEAKRFVVSRRVGRGTA